jgi:hypothetical protein
VVLVHAPGQLARLWQPVAARLTGYRVLAPDLPGHGESDLIRGDIAADIALLNAWLDAASPSPLAIVSPGTSSGLAGRLAHGREVTEIWLAPLEATGPGDADLARQRQILWSGYEEMFSTLGRGGLYARWRPDLLWTYVEEGTRPREDGQIALRCGGETEARYLELGRPLDGANEVPESHLVQPVAAASRLDEVLATLSGD